MTKANPAKVYAIKNEPSTSSIVKGKEILEGTLLFNGIYIRALFDTGASHSFISLETMENFHLTTSVDPICLIPSAERLN